MMRLSFQLNGVARTVEADPGENVRDMLERLGVVSVRNGCDRQGSCGLCTVLLDGKSVNTCLLLAPQIEGRRIETVESLADGQAMSAIQSAFVDTGVVQCGYCTPAMLLATHELLAVTESPNRQQITDALSGIFCRCTGYEQFHAAVALARERLRDPDFKGDIAPSFRDELRLVGKAQRKVDGPMLARGERAYVEDKVPRDACHLRMLRSPHAHAYVKSIDTSAAEAMGGVVLVVTHENCPDVYYNQAGQGFPEPSPYDRKMLGKKVRHVGDRVAVVVAESVEIAEQAIGKIVVEYEILPPVLSIDAAAAPGAPIIHNSEIEYVVGAPKDLDNSAADPRDGKILYQFPIEADPHRNIASRAGGGIGDVEQGFAEADVVIEREYDAAQVQCTPAEPHSVFTRMEGGRLVIHASTQVPWHVRRIVARVLGISENKIRVIKERVGGGFGAKQDIVLEEVAAYCTWATGRPVFFRFDRREEFIASRTRHPARIRVKLGATKDGKLTAMDMEVRANTGPYGSHCLTVPMNACAKTLPLFLCDNMRFKTTAYYSNIPPAGAYQGYGAPQGSFGLQLAIAELADALGMNPLDLIERNRVREGDMLEILKCLGEGRAGKAERVSSCGLGPAIEQGSKMIRWGDKPRSDDPDIRIGHGMAIIQQGSGLPGLDSANAAISMLTDGTFMLLSGGADLGTGLDTVTTKMAAECLCVDMADIALISGDTDVTPFDSGAYASSGTYFSGGAAWNAAANMKKEILHVAAELLGEPEDDLRLEHPSTVVGRKGSVSYRDIALHAETGTGPGQLSASGRYITDKSSFPYGAHFCEVAVNTRTGAVKIRKYYALQDCGTPINPELALGQIYGAVMKTIGHSLFEEMVLDDHGVCLNANLRDYHVPMIGDVPDDCRAVLIDTNDPHGPLGCKSVAEIGCNGAAPAIAAAIHDAAGVWVRHYPMTPERVLRELDRAGSERIEN